VLKYVLPLRGLEFRSQRARRVLRFIDAIVVDAVRLGPQQRIIAVVEQSHRKTAAVVRDAGDRPAAGPPIRNAEEMCEGKLVRVAHDEVVLYVEGG
jgi:hypothetical protein